MVFLSPDPSNLVFLLCPDSPGSVPSPFWANETRGFATASSWAWGCASPLPTPPQGREGGPQRSPCDQVTTNAGRAVAIPPAVLVPQGRRAQPAQGTHAAAPRERLELRGAGLLGAVPSARPSTWQWTGAETRAETRGTFSPHLPRCASEARGSAAETCLSPPFQVCLGLGFPMAESRVAGPVPLTRHEERGCPSACPGPGTRGPPTGTPHSRVTTLAMPRLPRPGPGRPRDTVPILRYRDARSPGH